MFLNVLCTEPLKDWTIHGLHSEPYPYRTNICCPSLGVQVPKGPQLKIQQACRTAGLIMSTTDNSDSEREDDQQVGNSSGGTRAPAAEDVDPEKDLCKICLDAPVEVTFLECGHQVCCFNCAAPMKDCPICREPISRMIKFFRS
ncbi:unnamed protein product [Choristocarpus tenellus]